MAKDEGAVYVGYEDVGGKVHALNDRKVTRVTEGQITHALALVAAGWEPYDAAKESGCDFHFLNRRLRSMTQKSAAAMLVDSGGKSWAPVVAEAALALMEMLTSQANLLADEDYVKSKDPQSVAALTAVVSDRITAAVAALSAARAVAGTESRTPPLARRTD